MTDHWYLPKNETAAGLPDQATRRLNDLSRPLYSARRRFSPERERLHKFSHPLSGTGGLTNKGRNDLRGRSSSSADLNYDCGFCPMILGRLTNPPFKIQLPKPSCLPRLWRGTPNLDERVVNPAF